jgi:signal transduction histidine kinase
VPPPNRITAGFTPAALGTGALLVAIFAALVIWFRSDLRQEIRQKIIERDATVLYPMALQQLADDNAAASVQPLAPLTALLKSVRQKGMLAVAVFDREGNTVEAVPASQFFVELPTEDFLRLQDGQPLTRYHPEFPLDQYFAGIARDADRAPVLEVLLPLPAPGVGGLRGFVRYYLDARPLAHELAAIDRRINRQTAITLAVGAALIALVTAGAMLLVRRAQRVVAERNARLIRTNFELTLAAKASAIGQITSHLIHEMQGSVAGLRAAVARPGDGPSHPALESAAGYTERLQGMIQETVALLGDADGHASYELTGRELADTIRLRNQPAAEAKGVHLAVQATTGSVIDSHRGGLLCLIANNLVQNAVSATEPGRRIDVSLRDADQSIVLTVADEGPGISPPMLERLFLPGRSGRPGGSGLGLAISQLLARQIGADLVLQSTGAAGTTFQLTVPRPG